MSDLTPLVYATPSACRAAAVLLGDTVQLENEVGRALGGRRPLGGRIGRRRVYLASAVAVVEPSRSRLTGRDAWLVVRVEPAAAETTPRIEEVMR